VFSAIYRVRGGVELSELTEHIKNKKEKKGKKKGAEAPWFLRVGVN